MFKHPINEEAVLKAAQGRKDILDVHAELMKYAEPLLDRIINDFQDAELASQARGMFISGLKFVPHYFSVAEDKTLADYPEVYRRFVDSPVPHFYIWYMISLTDNSRELREQILLRGLHHFYLNLIEQEVFLTTSNLSELRREFKALAFGKQTRWLSRLYNGMQAVVFEVFTIETLLGD